jgi:hypothetical protein
MRHTPKDFSTYFSKEKKEFWLKSYEEQQKIINDSYISMIVDEAGNLDKYKIIEVILDLQDKIEDLESTCQRTDSYYD